MAAGFLRATQWIQAERKRVSKMNPLILCDLISVTWHHFARSVSPEQVTCSIPYRREGITQGCVFPEMASLRAIAMLPPILPFTFRWESAPSCLSLCTPDGFTCVLTFPDRLNFIDSSSTLRCIQNKILSITCPWIAALPFQELPVIPRSSLQNRYWGTPNLELINFSCPSFYRLHWQPDWTLTIACALPVLFCLSNPGFC